MFVLIFICIFICFSGTQPFGPTALVTLAPYTLLTYNFLPCSNSASPYGSPDPSNTLPTFWTVTRPRSVIDCGGFIDFLPASPACLPDTKMDNIKYGTFNVNHINSPTKRCAIYVMRNLIFAAFKRRTLPRQQYTFGKQRGGASNALSWRTKCKGGRHLSQTIFTI